jgi:hypothetical protein
MNLKSSRSKVIASIAVVGTIAAVAAIVAINTNSPQSIIGGTRLLLADPSDEDVQTFQSFIQKHNRHFLTKDEYR